MGRKNIDSYLTGTQRGQLELVRRAADRLREVRLVAEAEVRAEVDRRISEAEAVRDERVLEAYGGKVRPASLLRALGTKDYRTLQDILSRFQGEKITEVDQFDIDLERRRVEVFWVVNGEGIREDVSWVGNFNSAWYCVADRSMIGDPDYMRIYGLVVADVNAAVKEMLKEEN